MQLLEIGSFVDVGAITNEAPRTYSTLPAYHITATYWTDIFFAPDESDYSTIYIEGFSNGPFIPYTNVASSALCIATEQSFYWDNENQKLWFHIDDSANPLTTVFSYEIYFAFTKNNILDIDGQLCLPLIASLPQIRQSEDFLNYKKLSFTDGSTTLNNIGGKLDYLIGLNLYGNNVFVLYIDPEDIVNTNGLLTADRADVIRQQAFYIEDYDIGIQKVVFELQDLRKSQNKNIPVNVFNTTDYPDIDEYYINKPIPLAYGSIREMKPIPTNGTDTGDVDYRAAEELTDFGTVKVLIDDVWTTKIPTYTNLATGEFILASADVRNAGGAILDVKLVDPIGIAITYASDVIVDLNDRAYGTLFTDTFYDTAEWAAEETYLSEIGIVFNRQVELLEAIRIIQNGSNRGFRYEFNSEGKRTIRIDREDRDLIATLHPTHFDATDLKVPSNKKNVYGNVIVNYYQSFYDNEVLTIINDDYSEIVGRNYKQIKPITIDSYLTTESDAEELGLYLATRLKDIPHTVAIDIRMTNKTERALFLNLRIFDIIKTALTPGAWVDFENLEITGREFYGIQALKIISIAPVPGKNVNRIIGKLLPNYVEYRHYDFTQIAGAGQQQFDFDQIDGGTQEQFDFTQIPRSE